MKPYSVVLAEDEKFVLLGLQTYFSGDSEEFYVAGAFRDGLEAWEYVKEHPPEVLIADIRMPVLDGIELIRRTKLQHPETRAVVLTCHDDFEYVRQAFTSGAEEYILKHEVEEAGLFEVLRRVVNTEEERSPRPVSAHAQRLENFQDFAVAFLHAKARGAEAETSFLEPYRFGSGIQRFVLSQFHLPKELDLEQRRTRNTAELRMVLNIIDYTLAEYAARETRLSEAFYGPDQDFVVLTALPELAEGPRSLTDTLAQIGLEISKYFSKEPLVGVSEQLGPDDLLRSACEQTQVALGEAFYRENGAIVFADERGSSPKAELPGVAFEAEAPLSTWYADLDAYLSRVAEVRPHPHAVQRTLISALERCAEGLSGFAPAGHEHQWARIREYVSLIGECDRLSMLASVSKAVLGELSQLRQHAHAQRSRFGEITRYIEHHFAEPLRLKDLANVFHVNLTYLSSAFREKTGTTVTKYINQCRIREAKRLIASSALSDKEIAFRVGYSNPNYFSRVFKQLEGQTVSEFRSDLYG
jgi:two-component system response regulator YesN